MDLITLAMANIVPDASAQFTSTVVIAGILIVVAMLVLLIIIFQVFGTVVSKAGNKKAGKKSTKVEDAPVIVESTPVSSQVTNDGVTGEIVAAISAAIYQLEGENAVVTSITPVASPVPVRKQNPITCRNPWAQAAVVENTMAF